MGRPRLLCVGGGSCCFREREATSVRFSTMRVAAFIDFQGTLGGGGVDDIRSLTLFAFSAKAIKKLNDHGVLAIGITNQSHIAAGEFTWDEWSYCHST